MKWVYVFACVLAVALQISCAGLSSLPNFDSQRINGLFQIASHAVASETGADLSTIQVRLVDTAHSVRRFVYEPSRAYADLYYRNPETARRNIHALVNQAMPSIAAIYVPEEETIFLVQENIVSHLGLSDSTSGNIEQLVQALLVHELLHAAQDKKYEYYKTLLNTELSLDSHLSLKAIMEGHAQYVSRKICLKIGCQEGFEIVAARVGGYVYDSDSKVFIKNFFYGESEEYINRKYSEDDAFDLARLIQAPPSPYEILFPEVYLDNDEFFDTAIPLIDRTLLDFAELEVNRHSNFENGASIGLAFFDPSRLAQSRFMKPDSSISWLKGSLISRYAEIKSPGRKFSIIVSLFASSADATSYFEAVGYRSGSELDYLSTMDKVESFSVDSTTAVPLTFKAVPSDLCRAYRLGPGHLGAMPSGLASQTDWSVTTLTLVAYFLSGWIAV